MKLDQQQLQIAQQIKEIMQDARYNHGECLHPGAPENCSGSIIRAHTVQKALLRHIADSDKQVYTPEVDFFSADDLVRIKKVSIRNASIFHGFCEAHDSELFQPIEVDSIQLNREHAFLLAYRALSLELFAKRRINEIDLSKKLTGDVHDPVNLQIANAIEYQQLGASIAIEDMATHAKMKQAFLTNDFGDTYFYAIRFNRIPDILSSGGISPICDIRGNYLQDLNQVEPLDGITLSLLPYGEGHGVALFAWYGKSNVNEKFIKSIESLQERDIPDSIVRFLFHHIENIFLKPSWWDKLKRREQRHLLDRTHFSLHPLTTPYIDMGPDGFNFVDWKVTGIKTNLKL